MPEVIVKTIIDAPKTLVWENLTNVEKFPRYLSVIRSANGDLGRDRTLKVSLSVGKLSMPLKVWVKDYQEQTRFSWGGPNIKLLSWFLDSEHYFVLEEISINKTRLIQGEKVTGLFALRIFEPLFIRRASPFFAEFNEGVKEHCETVFSDQKR